MMVKMVVIFLVIGSCNYIAYLLLVLYIVLLYIYILPFTTYERPYSLFTGSESEVAFYNILKTKYSLFTVC